MAEVIRFPEGGRPSPEKVRRLLREAAEDSSKLAYVRRFADNEEWYRLVTMGQVLRCFREGEVVDGPYFDEEGNWR